MKCISQKTTRYINTLALSITLLALPATLLGMQATTTTTTIPQKELREVLAPVFSTQESKNLPTKRAALDQKIRQELDRFKAIVEIAIEALQQGKLELFDALCGDAACQLRVPLVIELYLKYKDVEKSEIPLEDQLIIARLYLLTKAKRIVYKNDIENKNTLGKQNNSTSTQKLEEDNALTETIDTEAAESLLKKKGKIATLIQDSKALAAKNALQFLQKRLKNNTSLPELVITLQNLKLVTTPCTLSVYALLDYLKERNIALVLRGCSDKEDTPFGIDPKELSTPESACIDISKENQPIFMLAKNGLYKESDPVCIIDGIIGNMKALEPLSPDDFKQTIFLPNAAQHYQVGGKYKSLDLKGLSSQKVCSIPEPILNADNSFLKAAPEALKIFKISHISASTYGRRNRFLPIPLIPKKSLNPKENL
ncbi:TPA: hypothetical protein DDZ86_04925 [Candidatus Dependentiae bacterium]|nr:MAG: hypothetical protein A2Y17_09730 [Clostridiales bacterium GWF2_38_85]HBL98954.1 hypothetical protein [Candidatus Dependentiae bacterium]